MPKKKLLSALLLVLLFVLPASVFAQGYYFSLPQETLNVTYHDDGTASLDYVFVFDNDPGSGPIEFVDVGLPNRNFDENSISADVDGHPITDVSKSGFQSSGPGIPSGVAVGLGPYSIPPGATGQVHVFIGTVSDVLYLDEQDSNYASAVISPAYFDPSVIHGTTDLTVAFHLPPGVQPNEPRWHASPPGWPSQPETSLDDQGLVTYTWRNARASMDTRYSFGASFPKQYVPAPAIVRPGFLESLGISSDAIITFTICGGIILFFVLISVVSLRSARQRKFQYLPPKISIEGHGIKRGLTAVEAAILLEEPLDKILTMILFATIKKGAASVVKRDPLEIKASEPLPEGLQPYETNFLQAFSESSPAGRRRALQTMMIDLVQSVSQKMKGFSRRETIAYYRDIMKRAWAQVEAAETPEVKSQKFDEVMEWTMLDRNYGDRTREVFRTGPVFVPIWWPRYDPTFGRGTVPGPISTPAGAGGGGVSLPHLPGSDFAASMVHGVQNFSSSVIGNLTEFTGNVTQKTNPVPVTTTTSRGGSGGGRSGGGCACACACACAGCACACAGGGR